MELVTGRKGTPHVTSQQDRMLNQGIFGEDSYILSTGERLRTEIASNNEVKIYDGAIVTQGALSVIKKNTYDTVQIDNGNQGIKRHDLICLQYTYDSGQDTEKTEWVVVKGVPSKTPTDPSHTTGDIQKGDRLVQFPVFRVKLDGINIVGIDNLIEEIPNIEKLNSLLKDYVVESGKKLISGTQNYNYYEKWASGKLVQWGSVSVSYTDGFGIINYPVPFVGDKETYMVFAQPAYIHNKVIEILSLQKTNNTKSYVYSRYPDLSKIETHDVDWQAIGRWK